MVADRSIRREAHVADFAGVAVGPLVDAAVDDDAGAEPRAHGEKDHVARTLPRPESLLGQRAGVGIVLEIHRAAEFGARRISTMGISIQVERFGGAWIMPRVASSGLPQLTPMPTRDAPAELGSDSMRAQLRLDPVDGRLRAVGRESRKFDSLQNVRRVDGDEHRRLGPADIDAGPQLLAHRTILCARGSIERVLALAAESLNRNSLRLASLHARESFASQQPHHVVHDHQVFGRRNHAHRDRRVLRGDDRRAAHVVAAGIEHDSQAAEAAADLGARVDIVFADAAGEDQHVEAAQLRHEAADPARDGPAEFVDREARLSVTVVDGGAQGAHVVGEPAQAQQAGLLADDRVELIGGFAGARGRFGEFAQDEQESRRDRCRRCACR